MKINDINKENRPVERIITLGPEALTNEELLAILIHTGTKNKSCIDISRDIINSVPGIRSLIDFSIPELMKFEGIKESKAATIEAAIELTRRILYSDAERKPLITSRDCAEYLYPMLTGFSTERLVILYLDNKCKIIRKTVKDGSTYYCDLPYNEILKMSLKYSARGIIIAHNHPSGDSKPSNDDIKATELLSMKLEQFDMILFDHIIIGQGKYYSLNENEEFKINMSK